MSSIDLISPDNPSSAGSSEREFTDEDTTLTIGRNAALTLGTDSLIVLDEGFAAGDARCCGLLPQQSKTTRSIPYFNILWAELHDLNVVIHYANPVSKSVVRVAVISYLLDKINVAYVDRWVEKLLDNAYGEAQRRKRVKVLINPFGGAGKAQKWFGRDIEPILAAARCEVDVEKTQFKAHAIEIAEKLDVDAYDVVATCSGDGLPHEVFNGLGRRTDGGEALAKVAVVQLPCGTGNAMSWSLNGTDSNSLAALHLVKGIRTPMDLVSVTQGGSDERTLSFLSQSVGIIAESDLGTEHLRWMGDWRFTLGIFMRIMNKSKWPCDIALCADIEDKVAIKQHFQTEQDARASMEERRRRKFQPARPPQVGEGGALPPLRYGTAGDPLPEDWRVEPHDNLGNFYCGNMPIMSAGAYFFPGALPHDGFSDLVTIDADTPRVESLKMLVSVEQGKHFDLDVVKYRKVSGYRLIPREQKDGYISIDGEKLPFAPFQAEVHHGLGTVLTRTGHMYEVEGLGSGSSLGGEET